MDRFPIAARSLERPYHIDGDQFERQYKERLSGYSGWLEKDHADRWLVFPENVGERLSVDETSLSNGELYTVVTNKAAKGRKGAIVAIVSGTDSGAVLEALERIPMAVRQHVMEVTLDMAGSMGRICRLAFPNAVKVIDRFHVQKLALDAVQELRVRFRWDAMDRENEQIRQAKLSGKEYRPELLSRKGVQTGASPQRRHPQATPLPQQIPPVQVPGEMDGVPEDEGEASVRHIPRHRPGIFSVSQTEADLLQDKNQGRGLHKTGKNEVQKSGIDTFRTIEETIYNHYENILNFFDNRSTNASAESFNAKIKAFRRQLRGVSDVRYFLFRLCNIYA